MKVRALVALVVVALGVGAVYAAPKKSKPSPVVLQDGDPKPPCWPNCGK